MDAVAGFLGARLKPHWRPGFTGEGSAVTGGPLLVGEATGLALDPKREIPFRA